MNISAKYFEWSGDSDKWMKLANKGFKCRRKVQKQRITDANIDKYIRMDIVSNSLIWLRWKWSSRENANVNESKDQSCGWKVW